MVGRRTSTVVVALGACVALAGVTHLGSAAEPAPADLPTGDQLPLVEPRLLALAGDLGNRRSEPARSRLGRPRREEPIAPPPRRFELGPRTCFVAERCPSEPCIQFVGRDGRHGPACDRFPDPGDARMLPLARP